MNLAPNLSYAPIKAVDTEFTVAKLGKCPHGVKLKSGIFGGKESKCPKCEHELSLKIKIADLDLKMKEQKHAMELKEKELQLRKTYNTEFSLDLESVNGRPPSRRLNTLTMEEVTVLLHNMKMPVDDRIIFDNLVDGNMLSVVEKMEDLGDMGIHLSTLKCKVLFYNIMTFKTEGVAAHFLVPPPSPVVDGINLNRLSVSTMGSMQDVTQALNNDVPLSTRPLPLLPLQERFLSSSVVSTPGVTPRLENPTSLEFFSAPTFSPTKSVRAESPAGVNNTTNVFSSQNNSLLKSSLVPSEGSHMSMQSEARRELLRDNSIADIESSNTVVKIDTPIATPNFTPSPLVPSTSGTPSLMQPSATASPATSETPVDSPVESQPSTKSAPPLASTDKQSVPPLPRKISKVPSLQLSKDTDSIVSEVPKREMPPRRKSEAAASFGLTRQPSLSVGNTPRQPAEPVKPIDALSIFTSAIPSLGNALSGIFSESCPAVIEITSSDRVIEALKIVKSSATDGLFWETVMNTLKDIFTLINSNKDSLKAVVRHGAVQLTADVLYMYKSRVEIVKPALNILKLMSSEVAYQKLFSHSMISELLIETLDRFSSTEEVVSSVCIVFKNITANENHNNIVLLDSGGVCILLVDLLSQNKNNATLCLDILNAIRNISIYEHSAKFLGKLGLCELIVEILKIHQQNPNTVSAVCKVIKHIAVDEGNELELGSSGIADAFVDILHLYKNHDIISAKVCGAIVDVSFSAVNQLRFGAAGICETLVNVLKRHQNKDVVVEIACGTIKNIAVNNENEKQFGREGACEVLTDLLRIHRQSEVLVTAICAAIKNITFDDENRVRFSEAGVCELLLELACVHKNNERIRAAVKNLRANAEIKKKFQSLGLK